MLTTKQVRARAALGITMRLLIWRAFLSATLRGLFVLPCLLVVALSPAVGAQTAEQRTARYLESVRKQPPLLLAFLHEMPKGGDLHNHLSRSSYAAGLIDVAAS